MTDLLTWQDAWDVINDELSAVARIALAANPDKKWSASHYDNDRFPFSGVASFLAKDDPDAPEDLVISIQAHREHDTLTWSSDITTGAGGPLADGPSSGSVMSWMRQWSGFVNRLRRSASTSMTEHPFRRDLATSHADPWTRG